MGTEYNVKGIVRSGLVLHLDAANVKSYPGSGTTWFDMSGNNNHANLTYFNNTTAVPTFSNKQFSFDGVNNCIGIPPSNYWMLTNSSTFNIWCAPSSGFGNIFCYQKGGWIGYTINSNGATYCGTNGSNDIGLGMTPIYSWQMMTWVIDRGTGNYHLYRNGALINTLPITQPSIPTATQIAIGGRGLSDQCYAGSLSVAHLYSKALSATEISQNFNALRGRYGL